MRKNFIKEKFQSELRETIEVKKKLIDQLDKIQESIGLIVKNIKNGGKILICGNGGSAADAQHLAAEFLVRLHPNKNRPPIPALSLALDTSTITACGNDYNFNMLFKRNFEAIAKENDILIVISTSGKSKNIINVLKESKKKKIKSIGLLGKDGGIAKQYCDIPILVKKGNTARIQESHIFLGHFIFSQVEDAIFFQ